MKMQIIRKTENLGSFNFMRMLAFYLFLTIAATLAQQQECIDVLPKDSNLTCIQHAKWGRCSSYELKLNGYCQKTCGFCEQDLYFENGGGSPSNSNVKKSKEGGDQELPCFDIPPDELHTCAQQLEWGKCSAWWMKQNFCRLTCGQCQQQESSTQQVAPACLDIPPDQYFTCEEQKSFGKCGKSWMKERGFCQQTCNECIDGSNIEIIRVLPSEVGPKSSMQCSLIDLFLEHPEIKKHKIGYEFFKKAMEFSGKFDESFQQGGFEGVILIPTDEAILKYRDNLNQTAWAEIAKFHLVPGELNRNVVGPYEMSLQGSSVLLIKDEYVENEQRTSGALVIQTLSMFSDPLCQGQELDVWLIDALLFPPNVERPKIVKNIPKNQANEVTLMPVEPTQDYYVVPQEQISEITLTATMGLDQLLLVDEDYYNYDTQEGQSYGKGFASAQAATYYNQNQGQGQGQSFASAQVADQYSYNQEGQSQGESFAQAEAASQGY